MLRSRILGEYEADDQTESTNSDSCSPPSLSPGQAPITTVASLPLAADHQWDTFRL